MPCYVLALGSNVDNPQKHLDQTVCILRDNPYIKLSACSSVYMSPALLHHENPEAQPDFYNMVIAIDCIWHPEKLLSLIHRLEYQQGRRRQSVWQARPIDIDILLYSTVRYSSNRLKIPHPEMHNRDFVIRPLLEIQKILPSDMQPLCPAYDKTLRPLCHRVADATDYQSQDIQSTS